MVLVIDSQVAGVSGDMLLCSLVNMGGKQIKDNRWNSQRRVIM